MSSRRCRELGRVGFEALVSRYGLADTAAEALRRLGELVIADPLAPTSLREPARVLGDHLADSLVALELAEVRSSSTIFDLGAGAGFPGLPLAIARPAATVMLIESSARKCDFIRRAIAVAGAGNARAVHARAEAVPDGLGQADLVTARALAPMEVVAEYAAPLLRVGGTLVVWRGRRDAQAERAASRAGAQLGLEMREPRPVEPYPGTLNRHLHLMLKVRATPAGFPRRPGVARRRPLGHEVLPSDRIRR